MDGVTVLTIYAGIIIAIGVFPVFAEIYYESKPTKWVPQQQAWAFPEQSYVNMNKTDELNQFVQYASEQPIQPITTSDIPVFSADELPSEPLHSIPDEETLKNVDMLVAGTMELSEEEDHSQYFQFNQDIVDFERPNVMIEDEVAIESPLTDEEYQAIEKKYGSEVANMVTATPNTTNTMGFNTMIGKVVLKGTDYFLQYQNQFVKMVGEVPSYEGEVVLVSGHFVDDKTFTVMGWDDPEMVQHGYYSERHLDNAVV